IQNIVVLLPPAANFISNTVILGNPTSFTDISTGGGAGIISWLWNFGDGTAFSTIQNPVHTYSLYGQYSVTLTVTNSFGCSNSFTGQTLVVSQTSVTAAFTANDACNGQSAMFFDQSFSPNGSIASWYWNFDDSQTSSLQNPNHIYLNPGTYSVMLIAGDVLNNSDTCIHQITIFPVPSVNFTYNSDCFTNVVHFTNTSTISSGFISQCQWNFGDGNTAYICELQHAYSGFGAYNVTLAVISNLGCSSSLVHSIVVTPNPTANFHSQPNCVGYLTYFSDSSEVEYGIINNWHWEFGDGDTSALQNPEHTYNSAGDYDVLLIVSTNSGCLDTILRTVSINFAPHAGFNSMNACVLKDAQFTDLSTIAYGNITSWLWLFGDDSIAELQNPVHQYAFSGTFNVTLITTSNLGCMDTISAPVTVYPSPEIYFTSTTECMNSKTQFTNQTQISSGSVTSWNWDFDDGTFSSLQNPLHTFSGAETYSVTLNAISNFGCTGSHAENVNVYALPSANFYYNDACQGNITNFTDSSSIDNDIIGSWLWNFGDGASTILQNPNHLYFSEGIYIVKLKVSTLNGCSDSVAKVVHVYPAPVAYFTHEIACENHGTMFYNASTISSGSIITWNWNFGDLNADTAEAPVHTYLSAGSFLAILEVTAQNECTASYSDTIIVYPSPQIALDDDTILCGNDTKILDAGNPGAIYLWSSGANTQTIIAHEGDGKIWVIVEQNNCSATDTINILECNQNIVDVPTAFSPNNDGNNDVLYVYGNNIAELEFLIFNRFGELVFESHNQNHGWNGTRNEKQCEIEVYVYYLKCKFINGTIITKGGNVSLVK
ncbi:MAG: PKD domain-containing protein, partial [Bacteroidia bacterium]|nr:PKD domain-containing protein [Bacteroidia bacterium]